MLHGNRYHLNIVSFDTFSDRNSVNFRTSREAEETKIEAVTLMALKASLVSAPQLVLQTVKAWEVKNLGGKCFIL